MGGPADADERRPQAVRLVAIVPDEKTGFGECGHYAQAGGLTQAQPTRQFRQSEALGAVLRQEVEHGHHAFGGR
ncbi:Uncharacterised protein [Mycobacteroides abscessus subsp. massiliense]|nr:Uncharacterised protein [Mycobacteroides abscessus subsp. massiliense]